MKWDAWEAEKGKARNNARKEFNVIALQMLSDVNFDTTDPKKAGIEAEYLQCKEDAKASGKSDEQIEEESAEAVEIQ